MSRDTAHDIAIVDLSLINNLSLINSISGQDVTEEADDDDDDDGPVPPGARLIEL